MRKTILSYLAALMFLLTSLWVYAAEIRLERQLSDDELLSMPDTISVSLYSAPNISLSTIGPPRPTAPYAGTEIPLPISQQDWETIWASILPLKIFS